ALMRADSSDSEETTSLTFHLMEGNALQLSDAYYPERARQKIEAARQAVTAIGRDDLLSYLDNADAEVDAFEPPTPPKYEVGDHVLIVDPAVIEQAGDN